jgi:Zn-dependent protease with chaperone function
MTLSTTQMQEMAAKWERPKASPTYTLSVVLVSGVVVLLPLIYAAIIAAAGYGVFRYCTDVIMHLGDAASGTPRSGGSTRGHVFMFVLALAPAIAGVAIVLFMLKPFFAPRRTREDTIQVFRNEEPNLYKFVEGLCYVINAPTPTRIDVIHAPNASASFRGGVFSLFKSNDLVLTIGMPLVMGMTSQQLAGVIAHELGHFTQGGGMRAYYLTGVIGNWLERAAYQRDKWDAWLDEQLQTSPHIVLSLILIAVKFSIFVTRFVLKALFYLGQLICMHMSRQMEFDADRVQARFAGSAAFETVNERIDSLCVAFPRADNMAAEMWRTRKQLPDDMPSLIADASLRISHEDRARIERAKRTERTGFFLSHPPTRERLAKAKEAAEPGIYHNTAPASSLCTDASIYCKRVTYGMFVERLGRHLDDATFVPTATVLASQAKDHARQSTAGKYFGFEPPLLRPVLLSMKQLPEQVDLKAGVEKLKKAIAAVRTAGPAADRAAKVFREATERRLRHEQAAAVMDARLRVDFHSLEIEKCSRSSLGQRAWDAQQEAITAVGDIDAAVEPACIRLATALSLLNAPGIEKYVDRVDERRNRANELLPVLASLKRVFTVATEIPESMGKFRAVYGAVSSQQMFEAAEPVLLPLADSICAKVFQIRQECGGVAYPFRPEGESARHATWEAASTGDPDSNLGGRLTHHMIEHSHPQDIFYAGTMFNERFAEALARTTGELVEIAVAVEDALKRASAAKSTTAAGETPKA